MNLRHPELIIFDCDGVLVDSEPIASRLFHELINEIGLYISLEETVRLFEGLSDRDSVRIIEERLKRPVPAGLAASSGVKRCSTVESRSQPGRPSRRSRSPLHRQSRT